MIRVLLSVSALLLGTLVAATPAHAQSGEPDWARVAVSNASERSLLPASAIDYGAFAWMPAADVPPALSRNGVQLQQHPFRMQLGGRGFDPLSNFPVGDDPWYTPGSSAQPDYRLVQFRGPVRPEWLAALRAVGVEPVQYVHPFGFIVWADASALEAARSRPELRFAGDFLPAFRVPEQSRNSQSTHGDAMALVHRDSADAVVAAIIAAGIGVKSVDPMGARFSVLHLHALPARFVDLARMPGVYTVQAIGQDAGLRGEMSNQSIVGGYDAGNIIFPGYLDWLTPTGLDGSGVVVGIVDGGIRTSHQDLVSRMVPCVSAGGSPTSCTTSNNSHGTHVAGAVAGTGASGITNTAGFLRGQGVAPGASLVQQRTAGFISGGGPGGMIPNGMLTIFRESALSGALLTNNSWGPTGSPQGYDIPTMHIDMISRDANPDVPGQQPVLAVWSIMNGNGDSGGACAPSSLGSPDEAKNLLGVGSTALQNGNGSQNSGIFNISGNSAHGPACDGRIVPHVVAPGCNTDSTDSGSDTAFALNCGTSMASPVVSGAAAVFAEHYRDIHSEDPSPAMVKAMFTATATNLVGRNNADGGTMGHRPDRFQGWGRLDLDHIINPGVSVVMIDQDELFTATGQTWEATFGPSHPSEPMRIMLAWTDAPGPGTGGTTPAWVNDLDLEVESGASLFRGNVIDGATGFSATGGSADHRNNLEGVMLSSAQHGGGAVTVTVVAANIAADALDPWTPTSPRQDFALVCVNCAQNPDFTLAVAPDGAEICVPGDAQFNVTIGSLLGFSDTVTLGVSGLAPGVQSDFGTSTISPPGATTLDLTAPGGTAPSIGSFMVEASSTTGTKQRALALTVADAAPGEPLLQSPADGAGGQSTSPTLSWDAGAQSASYLVEVASDPAFVDIVFEEVTTDTSVQVDVTLATGTEYWWRVHASNACDTASSPVFRFRTQPAPGVCDIGTSTNLLFEEDFGGGSGGFVAAGSGSGGWALSAARPSPVSGGNAFFAPNPATTSDRHLTSPPIQLPVDELPITLAFQNWREIERASASECWDSGILEVSVNGGAFVQVGDVDLLNDPYTGVVNASSNVLSGSDAWCDEPARDWADTRVDLSAHAGDEIQLRWRLTSDNLIGREGWYVDDVRVQSCVLSDAADLALDKTVDPEIAVYGSEVVFTLTVANAGPTDATGVVVVDLLPSGYTFVSAIASTGAYDDGSGVWTLGDLNAEANATLDITATVLASGEYENVATVAGEQDDPNPANNSDSATVIAIDPAATDLSVTKEADVSGPGVGDTVVFTLTAANAGPANATGVVVQDLLPPGYAFVSAVASSGSYDENSGEWSIGDIDSGDSETLEITTTVELYDAWMNTATIDGDQDDPFPANNSASASANPDVPLDIFADGFE